MENDSKCKAPLATRAPPLEARSMALADLEARKEKKHKKGTLAKLLGGQSSSAPPPSIIVQSVPPSKHSTPAKDRDIIVHGDPSFSAPFSKQHALSIDEGTRSSQPERAQPEEKKRSSSKREKPDTSPREVINPLFGAKLLPSMRSSSSGTTSTQAPAPAAAAVASQGSPRDAPRRPSNASPRLPLSRSLADASPLSSPSVTERKMDSGRLEFSQSEEAGDTKEQSETSSSSEKRLERSRSESRRNRSSSRASTTTTPLRATVSASATKPTSTDEVRTENPLWQRQDTNSSPRSGDRVVQNPVYKPRFLLVTLLSAHNFITFGALADLLAKNSEPVARHMFSLLCTDAKRIRKLMRWSLRREVASEVPEQLFRNDSVPTRLLIAYFRMYGQAYLYSALKPIVRRVLDEAPFEIDPLKISNGKAEEGQERIKSLIGTLLADVLRAANALHPVLKRVVCDIKKIKGGEELHRIVFCAVFFLRFVSPAMVSPESFGITDAPSPDARRGLVLLSKVLQAVVTGVAFVDKEPYMMPLNSVITENASFVSTLIARIVISQQKKHQPRRRSLEKIQSPFAQDPPEETLEFFQQELADCKDKIIKRLAKESPQAHSLFVSYVGSLKIHPRARRVSVEPSHLLLDHIAADLKRTMSVDAAAMRRSNSEESFHASTIISRPTEGSFTSRSSRDQSTKVKSSAADDVRYLQLRLQAETVAKQTLERQVRALRADLEREVELRKKLIVRLSRHEGNAIFQEFPDSNPPVPHSVPPASSLPIPQHPSSSSSSSTPASAPGGRSRGISM